ncbi:MAG TPA: hypothetical protein VK983_03975 [Candidatus Limnocylindrales bacterium]|nr:hypothetical protein [Candidatus Limnocylindrales bacterium]
MDEVLARQLLKQLRFIKRLLLFFTLLFIASMVVVGIVLFKVVTFVNDTSQKINNLQQQAGQTIDIQGQLCDNPTVTALLPDKSKVCGQ